ncbi:MAG: hypothetical protein ACTH2U_11030 [Brevibacterium sp.]
MTESNYSFTTKIDGDLFTIRGNSIQEFQANLDAANQSGIGANIKSMVTSVNNTGALNSVLGATPVDPAQNPTPQQGSQPPAQNQQASPWDQGGQQGQGQWAQPQQAQQPQGNGGWGQPPQQQGGWGNAPQGGGDYRADPSIQPPHLQPPMTPFGPAKYKGGFAKSTGKPYRIWSDPRPWGEIKNLPKDQQFSQFIKDSEL